ncbi:MAG TPA: PD-(D/E)XK motif protein [Phnomibacter sp.]|nr:PD-(D/E)XK motif protein [Phnomibacter sp.]
MNLSEYWKKLTEVEFSELRQLRFPSDCYAELYMALDHENRRSLILYIPKNLLNYFATIQQESFANISIEFKLLRPHGGIVITLINPLLSEIFDDLIYSLYNKIYTEENSKAYISIFLNYYRKWSGLFEPLSDTKLSKAEIKGLIGEMIILEGLLKNPTYCNNETINGWHGPYGDEKDFFVDDNIIEVKAISTSSNEVSISSEYQLERVSKRKFFLALVELNEKQTGLNIQQKLFQLRDIINKHNLDFAALLTALKQNKINQSNISEYDDYKYEFSRVCFYDANAEDFPSITKSQIANPIKNVHYNIDLSMISNYRVETNLLAI